MRLGVQSNEGIKSPIDAVLSMTNIGFSVVVIPESESYSAWSPDLDIASQGDSVKEALANLKEAMELHLECLSHDELKEILKRQGTKLIATLEVPLPA